MPQYGKTPGTSQQGIRSSWTTGLTETRDYDAEGVGAIRWEGRKCYKWIKYAVGAGTVAAVAGQVAYYVGGATPVGYANSVVTSDLSDSVNIGAGVLMAAIPDANWGWVQIKGPATLALALTAGSDGNALTPAGSTDGTLDVSAAATDHVCAIAEDASAKTIICDFPF